MWKLADNQNNGYLVHGDAVHDWRDMNLTQSPVELWIDNRDDRLRVGMVTSVQFATESDETYAVIPRAALIRRDGQLSVFVIVEDEDGTRAVLRRARIGRSSPQTVELLEGAEIGERVVVEGLFALRDGARVSVEADLASNTAGPEQ